jgi:hypothetical protein
MIRAGMAPALAKGMTKQQQIEAVSDRRYEELVKRFGGRS